MSIIDIRKTPDRDIAVLEIKIGAQRLANEVAAALLDNEVFLKKFSQKPDAIQQPAPEPFAVSIPEAARLQGLGKKPGGGRSSINEQIARGELEAIKDGARTMVTMASLKARIASRPRAEFKPLPRRVNSPAQRSS